MSRPRRARTAALPLAVALVGVPLLGGCAAGRNAETSQVVVAIDGATGNAGPIGLRNVLVEPPPLPAGSYQKGGDALVIAVIVNEGTGTDRLVSVSSPAAQSAEIRSGGRSPGGGAPAGSSIDLGPVTRVVVDTDPLGPQIVLRGLTETLRPAQIVSMTFTFEKAGRIDIAVPVDLLEGARSGGASPRTSPPSSGAPTPVPSNSPTDTPAEPNTTPSPAV